MGGGGGGRCSGLSDAGVSPAHNAERGVTANSALGQSDFASAVPRNAIVSIRADRNVRACLTSTSRWRGQSARGDCRGQGRGERAAPQCNSR